MARVTFINAILSGKLAGTVYARNKAGYYVRNWTMPLDPRTPAQIQNRARFSTIASSWHALTDAQKAAWNVYGNQFFTPKTTFSVSPSSGFNAYTGLGYGALVAEAIARVNTITFPAGVTATFGNFSPASDPPAGAMSGQIKDGAGNPLPINLLNATLDSSNGAVTADFHFPAPQTNAPIFEDATTNQKVGILIQVSNPLTQIEEFVTNPRIRTVNVIKPPLTFTGWTSADKITFSATGPDLDITKFKNWYSPGQEVEIRAYLISESGAQKFLGGVKIPVL